MKPKSASFPIIIAVSIILTVFVGLSGIVISFISSDSVQKRINKEGTQAQDGFAGNNQEEEKDILTAPAPVAPPSGGNSGVTESNSETGIPIGTYSNPPTTVKSSGAPYTSDTSTSEQNPPIDNFGSSSSIESNSLTQQNGTSGIPNYSRDYSSNNYNSFNPTSLTDENSLVTPPEEDTFLNSPDASSSDDSNNLGISGSESTGINPLGESP